MIRPTLHQLPNGLRIVCVEMPHLNSAELAIYLKTGGRNDPLDKSGLSHFLEHMLFRGTDRFATSHEIEAAFEKVGGAANAATDAESTCYYSRIHPAHLRRGMEIFASMLLNPRLEGIDIERRIITEEALEDINEQGEEINPDTLSSRILWPEHPLGMPTVGTLDTIAGFTVADLKRHLACHYVPANTVVTVAGPVDTQSIIFIAEEMFGGWQGPPAPPLTPITRHIEGPVVRFVHDSDSQVSLQLVFHGFPRADRRVTILRLLRRILAGGGCSRLHLSLRERLGIIYSVDASIGAYDDTGCFAIDLNTAPQNLVLAVGETLRELTLMMTEPVPEQELERVRRSYIFDLEYSRDSTYEMGMRYGWGELMGMTRSIEMDCAEALTVTTDDIIRTAQELFAPKNLCLVAVGPWKKTMQKQVGRLVEEYTGRAP